MEAPGDGLEEPTRTMRLRNAATVAVAAVIAWVVAAVNLDILANPSGVPLKYPLGDGLFYQATVFKTIVDTGKAAWTPFLGAPAGTNLLDFPLNDLLLFGYVLVGRLFTSDWTAIFNFGIVSTYAFCATMGCAAALAVDVRRLEALAIGILYAFSCYQHHRIGGQVNIGWFSGVAAGGVAVALRLLRLTPFTRRDLWSFAVFAVMAGLSGSGYYGYFALWSYVFATAVAFARAPSRATLGRGLAMAGLTILGVLLASAGSIVHARQAGMLPSLAHRPPIASEMYALKLTHLVLPMPGHRIPLFAALREAYELANPNHSEASVAALGIVGTVAFLWTVLSVLGRRPSTGRSDVQDLGTLNICLFFLCTMGGLCSLVGLTGLVPFRSYNRVSVFLHFGSLLAAGLASSRWTWRLAHPRGFAAGLAALVALSTWETSYPGYTDAARGNDAAPFQERARFYAGVEARFPSAVVFQLPTISCPDSPKTFDLAPFDQLRPYLHTKTLHYSACSMHERPATAALLELGGREPGAFVAGARAKGFTVVFLHRAAYEDGGARLSAALTRLLGPPAFTSEADRLEIFDLRRDASTDGK